MWVFLKRKFWKNKKPECDASIKEIISHLEFNVTDIVSAGFNLQEALEVITTYEAIVGNTPRFLALKAALMNTSSAATEIFIPPAPSSPSSSEDRLSTHDYTNQDIANLLNVNLGEEWERSNITPDGLGHLIYYTLFRRNPRTNDDGQIIFPPVTCLPGRNLTESLIDMWTNAQHYLEGIQEILIPFNPGIHWVLLRINLSAHTIVYLDSLDHENNLVLQDDITSSVDGFRVYLDGIHEGVRFMRHFNTARLQPDDHACGVMVVDNMLDIANGSPPPNRFFSSEEILQRRLQHEAMLHSQGLSWDGLEAADSMIVDDNKRSIVTPLASTKHSQPSGSSSSSSSSNNNQPIQLATSSSTAAPPPPIFSSSNGRVPASFFNRTPTTQDGISQDQKISGDNSQKSQIAQKSIQSNSSSQLKAASNLDNNLGVELCKRAVKAYKEKTPKAVLNLAKDSLQQLPQHKDFQAYRIRANALAAQALLELGDIQCEETNQSAALAYFMEAKMYLEAANRLSKDEKKFKPFNDEIIKKLQTCEGKITTCQNILPPQGDNEPSPK